MARIRKRAKLNINLAPFAWIIIIVVIAYVFWVMQSSFLYVNKIDYSDSTIPIQYEGYKIVHITNIDNNYAGNVVNSVKKQDPDVIVISGGLVNSKGKYDTSVKLINNLGSIAPTYYILQESDMEYESEIVSAITNATYINGKAVILDAPGWTAESYIQEFMGVDIKQAIADGEEDAEEYYAYIQELLSENKTLSISGLSWTSNENAYAARSNMVDLLSESGDYALSMIANLENFDEIANTRVDIIFAGTTYGLKQNTSTEYVKGSYASGGTTLFVSGGVSSSIPGNKRILNFPEIQVITLTQGTIIDRNPLEQLLYNILGDDVGTKFDNDGGFSEYTYEYDSRNSTDNDVINFFGLD